MNYQDQVTEGRRLLKRSEADKWAFAKLTHEVVNAGTTQAKWAKDVGLKARSSVTYHYGVWERYGRVLAGERPEYSDAYATVKAGSDEPVTMADIRRQEREQQLPKDPSERAKLAAKLLADPEVTADPQVQTAAENLTELKYQEQDEFLQRVAKRPPLPEAGLQQPATQSAYGYLAMLAANLPREAKKVLREVREVEGPLPARLVRDMMEDVEEARSALDMLETAVTTPAADWDDGFRRLLENQ